MRKSSRCRSSKPSHNDLCQIPRFCSFCSKTVWASRALLGTLSLCLLLLLGFASDTKASGAQVDQSDDDGLISAPRPSVVRGFYDTPLTILLSSETESSQIRYTIDGSAPTPTYGHLYTEPLRISSTTILRAIAFVIDDDGSGDSDDDDFAQSDSATHTYIYLNDVLTQSEAPAGFPATWENARNEADSRPADYAMEDPAHWGGEDALKAALLALPTLSVAADVDALFGPDGMYGNGRKHVNSEWESAASLEWLYPNGRNSIQVNAGFQTRSWSVRLTRKRSFLIKFKSDYGPTVFKHDLFRDDPSGLETAPVEFDRLILRGGLNDSYNLSTDCCANSAEVTLTRDPVVRAAQQLVSGFGTHNDFVHLYINGLYWGVYNITEKIDGATLAEHFGGQKDDWFYARHDEQEGADTGRYQEMLDFIAETEEDFSQPENYAIASTYIDPTKFADYIIVNSYFGVGDWPHKNWFFVMRTGPEPEPGFFLVWDAEVAWATAWIGSPTAWYAPGLRDVNSRTVPARLWRSMIKNKEFRLLFADRVYKHLFNSGPLTVDNAVALWDRYADRVNLAIKAEQARWSDEPLRPDQTGERYLHADWLQNVQKVYTQVATNVDIFIEEHQEERLGSSLWPELWPPVVSEVAGSTNITFALALHNPNASGILYMTTDGTDPRLPGGAGPTPTARPVNDDEIFFVGASTHLKARIYDAAAQSWSALAERFAIIPGEDFADLTITEVMYNPADGADYEFIELYNRGTEPIDLSGLHFTKGITYRFAEITTLAPDETIVLAKTPFYFRLKYGFESANTIGYGGRLAGDGEQIALANSEGEEVLAFRYESVSPWPTQAAGQGRSLTIADANAPLDSVTNWIASEEPGGSPGAYQSRVTERYYVPLVAKE